MAAKDRTKTNRRRTSRSSGSSRRIKPNRSQTVLMSLVAAMTVAGALLYAVSRKPTLSGNGLSIPAMMSTSEVSSMDFLTQTKAPIKQGRWKAIVIHESGEPVGSQASLEEKARANNLRGIGYHFVVGNGNGMGDGEVYVSNRWLEQRVGAHCGGSRGDEMNREAIGICMVGQGDYRKFTNAQLKQLVRLVDSIQREFDIPAEQVYLYRDIANASSPGKLFPAVEFRRALARSR